MSQRFDAAIIGAGPAGMSAAVVLRRYGLSVVVIDEQENPGGQIYRAVEQNVGGRIGQALGPDYRHGADLVAAFRDSGAQLRSGARMWKLEEGWTVFLSRRGCAERVVSDTVLIATGAQERANPFPGWTLPGVMTVGAAQIALKSGGIAPSEPVWIAGTGPLPLLYMAQLKALGIPIAGFLDTTPRTKSLAAARHLLPALSGWKGLLKGARWLLQLRRAGIPFHSGIRHIEAIGTERLQSIRYTAANGSVHEVPASLLLTHEGLVPGIHATLSIGCRHEWHEDQLCFSPIAGKWGETTRQGVFVAGDGATIAGAEVAALRGETAAWGILLRLGRIDALEAERRLADIATREKPYRAIRPFLDALYRPRKDVFTPPEETIVCRCEEVTLARLRSAIKAGATGLNQLKAATRVGMGPCQGRQCGYSVASLLARECGKPISEVGFYNIRPPLKSVTLGELASLQDQDA